MDLGIAGKTALVTGASKGIGYAVAQALATEGVRVMLSARGEKTLSEAVERLRVEGGEVAGVSADVSKPESIETLLEATHSRFGTPDILVSNAGGPPAGKATDLADDAWAKGYDLTLMSNVRLSRAVLPDMLEQRWGRIINITSLSVKEPIARLTLSNAFRAAVTGFAKTLSSEVAAQGVTVNNIGPGYTATERLQELFDTEEDESALIQTIPARRFGEPAEIAAAAVFLASQQAAYITGQTLIVDGGVVGTTY